MMNFLQHFLTNNDFMNYYLIVIAIAIAAVSLFLLFLLFGSKEEKIPPTFNKEPSLPKKPHVITSHDIKAIAGDDVMTTQLDLARAYIEMGKKQLAKKILTHVMEHGDKNHQNEAHALIATL